MATERALASASPDWLEVPIRIGGIGGVIRTTDHAFRDLLFDRYRGFVQSGSDTRFALDIHLLKVPDGSDRDADLEVRAHRGKWVLRRGDFVAEWNPLAGSGTVRQTANTFSIDTVLRVLHSIMLARESGFLLHAASAIRNDRAYLFTGISGAGKTTIARLAPDDVTLLTDEISYVRRRGDGYDAHGTPFAGELATSGANCRESIAAIFLLDKGGTNRIEPVARSEAVRAIMRNILFFAPDPPAIRSLFQAACDLVTRVPVQRLAFVPDARVWSLIP